MSFASVPGLIIAALLVQACAGGRNQVAEARPGVLRVPALPPVPPVPVLTDDPITPEKLALGGDLFFDKRLSGSGKTSCQACHAYTISFQDNLPLSTPDRSYPNDTPLLPRNTLSFVNIVYAPTFRWDGSHTDIIQVMAFPLAEPNMNVGKVPVGSDAADVSLAQPALYHKLTAELPGYEAVYRAAFGVDISKLDAKAVWTLTGRALRAFVTQAVSRDAPFDRWNAGDDSAMDAAAVRGLTPLVGRQTEIEVFNKLAEQAASGKGQTLAMVGEPGLGKSRLVHEFTRHQLRPGWLVLEGASVSYGKATPYFPLIEMLRHYFQIVDGEGSENIRDQVVMHILELDPMLKDAIPPILALLGALPDENMTPSTDGHSWPNRLQDIGEMNKHFNSMDPQERRRYTLNAVKRMLIRESQRQPLLIVFEDLHWIDSETQAFLDGFVESLPMARIVLLVDYRPEYSHSWGDKSYYTQIRVDPLQLASAEELLQYLLGSNKDLAPLKELLMHRTEGNPFFAEESVRSLVEAGLLVGEKGAYRPGLKIDEIRIPNTIQNLLADRIDRLTTAQKHLLHTAAVIGVVVPFRLVRSVAELPDDELYECLAKLQSAEFIHETNLFPEVEYSFKHALTTEVAYGALLHDRRTFLHGRILKVLEEIEGNVSHDHLEKLAHHAFQGEIWDKAVNYSKEAGTKAMGRSAYRGAVIYFDRALASLEHLPKSRHVSEEAIDLRLDLRNALFPLEELDRLRENLRAAESLSEALGDQRRLGGPAGRRSDCFDPGRMCFGHTRCPRAG